MPVCRWEMSNRKNETELYGATSTARFPTLNLQLVPSHRLRAQVDLQSVQIPVHIVGGNMYRAGTPPVVGSKVVVNQPPSSNVSGSSGATELDYKSLQQKRFYSCLVGGP